MRLQVLSPLLVRARTFALELAQRHGLRTRHVGPATVTLARRAAAGPSPTWHLHVGRHTTNVEQRLSLSLTLAAPPMTTWAPTPANGAAAGHHAAVAQTIRTAFRHTERRVERHEVELRVAGGAERMVERTRALARRLEGESGIDRLGRSAAGPQPAWAPPPLALCTVTPRPTHAIGADPQTVPASVRSALAASDGDGSPRTPRQRHQPPSQTSAPADVERLADSVLDALDRRATAHRERLGTA